MAALNAARAATREAPAPNQARSPRPAHNPWAIALTVTMATFMELLDTSISNVSLPHIAGGLGTSYDESTWVLTSYLVANAIILPMSAWLSRVFGRKRYYMMCVALFTATSLLCGLAPSLGMLVFFRVLQGIGGGGLAPVEQAILVDTFPRQPNAAGPSRSTVWRSSRRRLSGRRWADGLRTASHGAGFSSSTSRSDCCRCCFRAGWFTTRWSSPRNGKRAARRQAPD